MLYISLSICYYFIKLFKVRPGSCAHECFNPRSTSCLEGLHLLLFSCQCHPSWGRSARRMILFFVSCQNWHGQPLPIIFYFYKVYLKTLDGFFSVFSAMYDLDIWLRDPLLRVLLRLNVSNVIGGGFEVVRYSLADFILLEISIQAAGVKFMPDLFRGFRSCCRVALLLRSYLAGFFRLFLVLKVSLFSWGFKLSEGLIRAGKNCPEKSSRCLLVFSFSN